MLKNKNIVYLITQTKFGGAQRYVIDLASHFSANNNVTLLVGESQHPDPVFYALAKERNLKIQELKHLQRGVDVIENIRSVFEIRRTLKKLAPDILHINSSMAGFTGSLAALLYNMSPYHVTCKVVYTAHGFVFNEPLSPLERWLYIMLERISASWKRSIITVSDFDKKSGEQNNVGVQKLTTIHIGVNPLQYDFLDRAEARKRLSVSEDDTVIGTIASLYPTKGLKYLLPALATLQQQKYKMIIVTYGGPEKQNLEKQIQELNLTTINLFTPEDQGYLYLKAFDVFVLPSVKEGLPYVILEAGLAEIPVVATMVGGIPEVISNEKSGLLVESGKPDQLATALQRLISNPSLRLALARENFDIVTKRFSLEKMLQQTDNLYSSILPGTERPSNP